MSLYPNDDDAYAQAKKLVRARGGQWCGTYGMARCPAHNDTNPSLSVTQKKPCPGLLSRRLLATRGDERPRFPKAWDRPSALEPRRSATH
jgi:hypothetical protein